jgi:hypothetical protein
MVLSELLKTTTGERRNWRASQLLASNLAHVFERRGFGRSETSCEME